MSHLFSLAKKIRKEGETWQNAVARAKNIVDAEKSSKEKGKGSKASKKSKKDVNFEDAWKKFETECQVRTKSLSELDTFAREMFKGHDLEVVQRNATQVNIKINGAIYPEEGCITIRPAFG